MPRVAPAPQRFGVVRRFGRRANAMDRPSRLHIFARRQRRMVRPALLGLIVLVLALYGLHVARAMRSEASFAPIRAQIGRAAGLRVARVIIEGRDMTPESQVLTALGVARGDALLGFSVEAARRRIDRLAFVEHSAVERRLPGTVLVHLTERRPFAVWQNKGHFVLIDRKGEVVISQGMTGKDAEAFAQLPLVVGAGAPEAATALIDDLQSVPSVRQRVSAAVRVGERRWNLVLRSGASVLLPEGAELAALRRLAQLQDDMRLLERPLAAIDMRLPDRLVVRPLASAPGAAGQQADPDRGQEPAGGAPATRRPA